MLYDWYFGMTAHIKVDSRNRLIRSPMARNFAQKMQLLPEQKVTHEP